MCFTFLIINFVVFSINFVVVRSVYLLSIIGFPWWFKKMNPVQSLKGAIHSLRRDHRGVMQVGALILGLVVSMITIYIAVLLGGVLSSQVETLFGQFNLTNTQWQTLFSQTQTIATSAISVAVIGFLIAAFMVVIGIFAFKQK